MEGSRPDSGAPRHLRLRTVVCYLLLIAPLNLLWEFAHLPLYTVWSAPDPKAAAFAAVHCSLGDVVLAAITLAVGMVVAGSGDWPARRFVPVAAVATLSGMAATVYVERMETQVWDGWAYSDLMPVLPWIEVGLSPILQWTVLPPVALVLARRLAVRRPRA